MGDAGEFWRDVKAASRKHLDRTEPQRRLWLRDFIAEYAPLGMLVDEREPWTVTRMTFRGVTVDFWPRRGKWHNITTGERGKGFAGVRSALGGSGTP